MIPIQLRPDNVSKEMTEFARKLGDGLQNLTRVGALEPWVTPRDVVYEEDRLVLYRFRSPDGSAPRVRVPVLIVYALVNRPYMTDLQENRSTIRGLLDAGLDVYLIDWGYPDRADRFLTLDDYINGYLDRCIDVILDRCGGEQINLLGICQGGVFALCYAAMHARKVKNLVTMVTPVDFHTPDNMLSRWARKIDADMLVDTLGNVPGELLNWTFLTLKPFQLMSQKYVDMVDALGDAKTARNFLLMEKWIFDSPDQAGEAFRQFVKDFFQNNGLIRNTISIGPHRVDLKNVKMPVLNVYAAQDHLVPPDASRAMQHCVGTDDYEEISFQGGHIGIYVSGRAQKEIPPAIGRWLESRS